ncbi:MULTISPECIES: thiamine pyrophosphate-dependent dehydrogenase E1 component subunit alpha [Bacillus]|uniref:2-oxoisovalerate dehydrogenase subunit alpha n=2 Tax=Bacillus TaxID=1386 RepID=A0A0M4FTL3_9BACI|nr:MULTISPECIES: thiamine pyrophosphate-dependent dehydrogenase E1 component subunit alpha [Bacillus]ALC81530.1 2-oxoisovalerate dehydrogenase [Bacillus gobiensis]MBP1080583.1 2-oxoisovalerate dehydrogenase E1 component alpha subunit [Bacillus capparidis]MED1094439.1 thiamine pyrophosphate-dependent dehydrogenase E1 component subunit alpha [Bacillus capparidis]
MGNSQHKQLGISDSEAIDMYQTMLLARKIDERMWLLNRSGKIPFVVSCQGQEAAQVGASFAMDRENDYVLPYYRDMGVVLSFGMTAVDLMLSGFAKAEDPNSGGKQMPGHFGQKKNRIVTGSSPVTTQVPHAVGIALASRLENKKLATLVTFGEGSSNQGDFHEGANFAAVHKLPVIFMCENNKFAISVPYEKQVACERISDRAVGYGMPGVTVDGNDLLAVYQAVKEARERAMKGEGPTLIETISYRMTPHSSDDDDRIYREEEELAAAKQNDPLKIYEEYLTQSGLLTEESKKPILEEVMKQVNEATEYAEAAPYAEPEAALRHVFAE